MSDSGGPKKGGSTLSRVDTFKLTDSRNSIVFVHLNEEYAHALNTAGPYPYLIHRTAAEV